MKVAIMQPYVFPYIGYFQLINAVDKFVLYDNIEYSKKGWINRNRILINGRDEFFTIPLKRDSDYLDIDQRKLAETYSKDSKKIINKIESLYRKAPFFEYVFPLIESVLSNKEENLFQFLNYSLIRLLEYLDIKTEIIISSSINIDKSLKSQDRVIAICKALNATHYINPIGGTLLYSHEFFAVENIKLSFLQSNDITYKQFNNEFVPWLSIIDVMMFNSKDVIQDYLKSYSLK